MDGPTGPNAYDCCNASRGQPAAASRGRLLAVFFLTLAIFATEGVGGFAANSLALIADAGQMLTDVSGIGLALLAIWIGSRAPGPDRTFGYQRLEILAAVVNAILLIGVGAFILLRGFVAWPSRPRSHPAS